MIITENSALHDVYLEPDGHVQVDGQRFVARTTTPWLKLRFVRGIPAGRWVSLVYCASYFDSLTRPIVRFVTSNGYHDRMAPAPLLGRATWIGRIPGDTHDILISPVDRAGPFSFAIESCRPLSRTALAVEAWARNPHRTLLAITARCIGRRSEAHRQLAVCLSSVTLARYHAWRAARWRDLDPAGLEAPRSDWSRGPHILIVAGTIGVSLPEVGALLADLSRQIYPHWSLAAVMPSAAGVDAARLIPAHDIERLRLFDADADAATLLDGMPGEVLVASIDSTDRVPPHAFAVLAEHAVQHPAKSAFYGDDDAIDATGCYVDPRLKPDWSPALEAARPYVGTALFIRAQALTRLETPRLSDLVGGALNSLLLKLSADDIEHIPRVLLTRRTPERTLAADMPLMPPRRALAPIPISAPAAIAEGCLGATIVIPSRDRVDLLAACLRSLDNTLDPARHEIIVVDNGSIDDETLQFYNTLKTDRRCRVIDRPGPFNFSFLCNEAALQARGDVLVFLNNDVTALDSAWLAPLLSWASRPDIGAVGAKLLYPSGRLQHGGVVIGLGGVSGHIDSGARGDDTGYLQRRAVPHEVAAVTAACLAVEKKKFDAVGGFDAENLPIELNDIDLCLRLAERGWRTIFTPQSVLVHHESASRGRSTVHSERYRQERNVFRDRWRERLSRDPYFHPSLSLTSIRTALG